MLEWITSGNNWFLALIGIVALITGITKGLKS